MGSINKLSCPRTENEIKTHWKYTDKIYTTCICTAYNHENYIKDTLDSILAQKTEYRFELVIHDDKSTDNTTEIILEYKSKFPNIITLIMQDENQYSKGKKLISLVTPFINGEYTAICEGDDFWTDEFKIQKQISSLIKNPKINLCTHGAVITNETGDILPTKFRVHRKDSGIIPYRNVFLTGGQFCATASMFFRTNMLNKELPLFFKNAPVGDFPLEVYLGLNNIYYIPDIMSTYRLCYSNNSWSTQTLSDISIKISFLNKMKQLCWEIFTWLPVYKKINIFYKLGIVNKEISKCYMMKNQKSNTLKYWFFSLFIRVKYNKDDISIIKYLLKVI
ncbi:TPA: glycosyltransferase [Providencia rettgeri]|nr:glycosyltransferase [Providencia rettgeri]